ncbi:hypothetical protein Tco_0828919 [Tanacetum coccineum]
MRKKMEAIQYEPATKGAKKGGLCGLHNWSKADNFYLRIKQEESKITAWENLQKPKAKTEALFGNMRFVFAFLDVKFYYEFMQPVFTKIWNRGMCLGGKEEDVGLGQLGEGGKGVQGWKGDSDISISSRIIQSSQITKFKKRDHAISAFNVSEDMLNRFKVRGFGSLLEAGTKADTKPDIGPTYR